MRKNDLYYCVGSGEIKTVKNWIDFYYKNESNSTDIYKLLLKKIEQKKLIKQN